MNRFTIAIAVAFAVVVGSANSAASVGRTATVAPVATAKPDPAKAKALAKYLAAASTTVKTATGNVLRLDAAIADLNGVEGALAKVKLIRSSCEAISSSGADRRLTNMSVPAPLQSRHLRLAASFTHASDGCDDIAPTLDTAISSLEVAIQTRAVSDLTTALEDLASVIREARDLRGKLRPGAQARVAWRFTVLQYAGVVGLKPPAWVKNLK